MSDKIPSPKAFLDKMIEHMDVINAELIYELNLHSATCECNCQSFYELKADPNYIYCAQCGVEYDRSTNPPYLEPTESDPFAPIDGSD